MYMYILAFLATIVTFVAPGRTTPSVPVEVSAQEKPESVPEQDSDSLVPGQTTERTISTGSVQSHVLSLEEGQYARIVAEGWGIDIEVSVVGPEGEKLREVLNRSSGPTSVSLIAPASGVYQLVLQPREKTMVRGHYKLSIGEIRPATPQDRGQVAAEKAFAEAKDVQSEWTEESSQVALSRYQEALELWRAAGEDLQESNALEASAAIYVQLGESQKALDLYGRALQIAERHNDHGRSSAINNGIGRVYWRLGQYQKSKDLFTSALSMSEDGQHQRGQATALNGLGDVYYMLGDLHRSLDYYDQALRLWGELMDRRGRGLSLMNIGYTYADLSEDLKSLDYFNEALELWRMVDDRPGEASTLRVLGNIFSKLGEKQKALDHFDQARQLLEPMGDKTAQATLLNGMGQVYYELNQAQTALRYHQDALRLSREIGFQLVESAALIQIGRCHYALDHKEDALDHYERALEVFRASSDQRMTSVALGEMAEIYESLGNTDKAIDYYNKALTLKRAGGDRRAQAETLNDLGRLFYRLGDLERASDYLSQALPLARAAVDRFTESLSQYQMARVERDRGHLVEALTHVEAALEIGDSLRAKVGSQQLRASYFASIHKYHEFYIDLLMSLHKERPSEGFDGAALYASERARARSLLESVSESSKGIRRGVDPRLLERERSLRMDLNAKAERQMRMLRVEAGQDDSAAALEEEIRELTSEYERVQGQIRSRSPQYAALTQPLALTLKEIQEQVLDDNTILLEFALGDERSYLWAVTEKGHTSHALPSREAIEEVARLVYENLTARLPRVGESLAEFRGRVRQADSRYWQEAGRLSEMLLGPVSSEIGSKRLLVVTDGVLQYLPFGALPVPAKTDGANDPLPLAVEHEIVNLPSASTLAVLRKETGTRKSADRSVVVFADPVFETDDPRLGALATQRKKQADENQRRSAAATSRLHRALRDVGLVQDGSLVIPRLLATRREANAIVTAAARKDALKAIDFQANREMAMSAELQHYQIIHFATHGLLNNEHPELSGIILSMVDEQGRPLNGFLRLHDIYNLELRAELVVLSACNSALGKEIRGEGLVGLVRGFMYAGAPRVVASLWKVDDEATGELMKRFYQHMFEDDSSPAAALRQAQIEMWRQKLWRSPFYWAAFVIQGDWQ